MHNHDDFPDTRAPYKHDEFEDDEDLKEDLDPNEEVVD